MCNIHLQPLKKTLYQCQNTLKKTKTKAKFQEEIYLKQILKNST